MVQRFEPGKRMSQAVVHNGTVYLAGQVADEDPTQDIAGQTRQVLAMIDRLLEQAGSDKRHILMAQIFLADMADFAGMNSEWDRWVPAGHTPARATVQAALAVPEWKIEIVVTAAVA
ncbi:MAG TPA: RidA family protein [Albitalea sp.]|uniref:RidA family protein n=1 Tax=Piscinibacter sp. TaxID=1903157 RepID=UPI002ECFEDAD